MRRRRLLGPLLVFALVGVAVHTGLSFAGTEGLVATGGRSGLVMVGNGVRLPEPLSGLRYSSGAGSGHGRVSGWRPASLQMQVGGLVQVVRPGDLVLVDTTGAAGSRRVTIYLTDLPALRQSYSSIVLPLAVWQASGTTAGPWTRSTTVSSTFITDASGRVSFTLPAGRHYDITLEQGGSLATLPGRSAKALAFFAALS